jgi:hypothetical protein
MSPEYMKQTSAFLMATLLSATGVREFLEKLFR